MTHELVRPVLLACSLLALACDKPSSDPDAPTGGGVGGGEGASAGAEASASAGAAEGGEPATPVVRTPVVAKDHDAYARFEGGAFANECKEDTSCKTGGCSSEVCTAEEGVITTCEVIDVQLPPDASCGCVHSECVWWSPSGATLTGGRTGKEPTGASTEEPTPNSGEAPSTTTVACGTKTCKPGQECVGYYGIAGPKGPKFESCEWRCTKDGKCPKGTKCVTIADGPGRVCR